MDLQRLVDAVGDLGVALLDLGAHGVGEFLDLGDVGVNGVGQIGELEGITSASAMRIIMVPAVCASALP